MSTAAAGKELIEASRLRAYVMLRPTLVSWLMVVVVGRTV